MKKVAITLGLVCLILTMAVFIQIKTVKSITNEEGISLNENTGLKNEVFRLRQLCKDAHKQLEETEKKLEETRTQVATKSTVDIETENQIKKNNRLLGLSEVNGSGIIIKLDDNREVNAEEVINISSYLVHDGDLIHIVNELFNAGADAVSINGKRIVNTTAIFCDGNIIRVNGEIVGVPIEIKAIGFSERLYYDAAMRQGSHLGRMAQEGVKVEVQKSEDITIPKYEGVYKYEYITSE